MVVARRAGLGLVLFLAACGGGGTADDDGGDDDGGFEESTPILELAPRIARACTVVSPTTEIGDGLTSGFDLVTFGGRHHALTTRYDETLALAPLSLEPIALGPPSWTSPTAGLPQGVFAVPREGGGLVLAWAENDLNPPEVHRIVIAIIDENGAQLGATRYLGRSVVAAGPILLSRPGGYSLAWNEQSWRPGELPLSSMWLVPLDPDGAPTTEPTKLVDGGGTLVRHGAGYAAAWSVLDENRSSTRVALLDADGRLRTEPWIVPVQPGHHTYEPWLISTGPEVLITWTEAFSPGYGDENGYAIVRLARMADDGSVGPVQRLQAPETGMVNVNSTIAPVDGAITLSWSRGDYIAVCGGCMSDNDMHLVQLDPVDLAPISNVATFGGPSGLRSAPIETLDGRDFAYLLAIDRHARFDFAAAMVRCEPAP